MKVKSTGWWHGGRWQRPSVCSSWISRGAGGLASALAFLKASTDVGAVTLPGMIEYDAATGA